MATPRPRECEPSRYRHGCDPPRKTKDVSPSDCTSLNVVTPPRVATSPASTRSLIRLIELQPSLLASVFQFIQREGSKKGRRFFMPSTITLVVPRAENESIFLQLVIQAAIRAHRDD